MEGGQATTMSWTFLRSSSSRAMSPASIVLPSPTSSAMKRLTRGKPQGLAKRLELVGVDPDAGAEGRLKEVRVRRRDAVPAERMQIGREEVARIEASVGDLLPRLPGQDLRVDFLLPEHRQRLPLGVVVEARHSTRVASSPICGSDILDKVLALPDADDLAGFWNINHGAHIGMRSTSPSVIWSDVFGVSR